ncbi:hypothetical protein GGD65_008081 [Bradyrhizobium sp. CIR18]|uniref:hypothetical protein n=1 Tax=Bradyrhizobium sp. CIR18 TaxID=2663839 RepID=UPI0016064B66|nr:hypothetical protein [Bradyrhizobium sp. CIR18]MBB4367007.1 hypothetical protein [Bradyrhizobium sp. CIR18]
MRLTESAVRSRARRDGYMLRKSRRKVDFNNLGDYMLLEASTNCVVRGGHFDATLDEIAEFLEIA